MGRYKVILDTKSDAMNFIDKANQFPKDSLRLVDKAGHEVNAQSLLGVLYTFEWAETYLYSKEEDVDKVYRMFKDFID